MGEQKEDRGLGALEPEQIVLARCDAFRRHDFRFIFQSYHRDAPFRQAFTDCGDYLAYADQALRGAFRIHGCRVLDVRSLDDDRSQVLFVMEVASDGELSTTVELAEFKRTPGGWRYFCGAKRPRGDFDCPLEDIEFGEFLDSESLVFF